MSQQDEVQVIYDYDYLVKDDEQRGIASDPGQNADKVKHMAWVYGSNPRLHAFVPKKDVAAFTAFSQQQYETVPVNGERSKDVLSFMTRLSESIREAPPKHLVVVTCDPAFKMLLDAAAQSGVQVWVWAPKARVPIEFQRAKYNIRPLEQLIPSVQVARVVAFMDLENILIPLAQRGIFLGVKHLLEVVRTIQGEFGQPGTVMVEADFGRLPKPYGSETQREFLIHGAQTRYLVSLTGKSSSDHYTANDIRNEVERDMDTGEGAQVIVLFSGDKDLRAVVEEAKSRGRKVVIVALQGSLSRELRQAANEVRILDDYLKLETPNQVKPLEPWDPDARALMAAVITFRRKGWKWASVKSLCEEGKALGLNPEEIARLVGAGLLRLTSATGDHIGVLTERDTVQLNLTDNRALGVQYLARWVVDRLTYLLKQKGMPWCDQAFLARGMAMDERLGGFQIGQDRANAAGWLDLLCQLGEIRLEVREHPKDASKQIKTYWLTEPAIGRNPADQPKPGPFGMPNVGAPFQGAAAAA